MRHQHVGVGIGGQILFQPVAGFQVEVVGGLVEQQQVGLFEQQLGERDAHLPAAGELFGAAFPIALRKAEAAEHGAHLRFDGVAVARAELAFGLVKPLGDLRVFRAGGVEFGHAVGQVLLLLFELAQVGEHGHALGEDGAAGEREPFLRQVAEGDALLGGHDAGIESLDAGQHFQERRLAGAVGAHDAGAFVGRHQPVGVFKKDSGAVTFSRPCELDHRLTVIVARRGSGTRTRHSASGAADREKETSVYLPICGTYAGINPVIASIATDRLQARNRRARHW